MVEYTRFILKQGTDHVISISSQVRMIKFLLKNGRNFLIIDQLCSWEINESGIGCHELVSFEYVKTAMAPQPNQD